MGSKKRLTNSGVLGWIERGGNALPHPASLFGILALTVLILSFIGYLLNWHAIHPSTGEDVRLLTYSQKMAFTGYYLKWLTIIQDLLRWELLWLHFLGIGVAESQWLDRCIYKAIGCQISCSTSYFCYCTCRNHIKYCI